MERQRGKADLTLAGQPARPPAQSLRQYARGAAGGLVFSLPLFLTEEVWVAGTVSSPLRLLGLTGATLVLLVGINLYAGLRRDHSLAEVLIDAIEEMGLGLLIAATLLFLLDQIGPNDPLDDVVGQVVLAAMKAALGVSVGNIELGDGPEADGSEQQDAGASPAPAPERQGLIGQVALAACGALLFAASTAPVEEVARIGAHASLWRLLGLCAVSFGIGATILSYGGLVGQDAPGGPWLEALSGTVVTYAVALLASALNLWFYHRFDGAGALACVSQTVVLGLPSMLGASAGRLLLRG